MLSQISWYNYVLYSLSIIGIYYSYVLVVYYRKEVINLLKGSKPAKQRLETISKKKEAAREKNTNNNPDALEQLFTQALALSEAVKSVFQEISFQEGTKEELFVMLRSKIDAYPSLQATPFRVAIQNVIQSEATRYQIDLGQDQKAINALWVGA